MICALMEKILGTIYRSAWTCHLHRAWRICLSSDRRAIRWRTVAWGLGLQVVFAFLVIKWTYGQTILAKVSGVITGLLGHSADGSSLVFGALGDPKSRGCGVRVCGAADDHLCVARSSRFCITSGLCSRSSRWWRG